MSDTLRQAIADEGGLAIAADLAARWGITATRAAQLIKQPGFPEPVAHVAGGRSPLWSIEDAHAFRAFPS